MGRLLLSRRKGTLGQGNHVGEGREVGISTGEATAPRVERGQKTRWRAAECVCPGPRLQGQLERRVSTCCRWERGALEISMLSKKCRSIWLCGGGFPGGPSSKELACNAGNPGLIPGWGRFPGEGDGKPLQYSCLMKSMDKRSLVGYGIAKSQTRLSD